MAEITPIQRKTPISHNGNFKVSMHCTKLFYFQSPGFTANNIHVTVHWSEHLESRWPVVILNDINICARVLYEDLKHFTPNKKNCEV